MKARKYDGEMDKIYNAMLQRFRRSGANIPGVLASFYLDVFVFKTRTVKADDIYSLNLAEQGTFSEVWREEQKKIGYLTWTVTQLGPRSRVDYKPGPKILKYINDASMLIDQVVTRSEFDVLSLRVDALETALDTLIELVDPPTSIEKRRIYTANPERLFIRGMKSRKEKSLSGEADEVMN